jgi:thiamine-monophosphate kinase
MTLKISQIGEFGLIRQLQKNIAKSKDVIKGIGDDTAVLPGEPGKYLLFTADMIAEGTHFTKDTEPELIGHKALACNISDVAAMGGIPTYCVVSIGMPANKPLEEVKRIYSGMERLARKVDVNIVGGDTIKSDKVIINIALLGEVKKTDLITRCGAKEGDWIVVTGPLGCSLDTGKHLNFRPRLAESQFLIKRCKPNAMIDISDGLAGDLKHILDESNVGAVIYEEMIPKTEGAELKEALFEGEDFELLFTVSPQKIKRLLGLKTRFRFYPIGQIVKAKEGFTMVDKKKKRYPVTIKSFAHF